MTVPTVDDLLVAVAARGLDTSARIEAGEPLGEPEWQAFHAQVRQHHLSGLLAMAIASEEVPVTAEQDGDAAEHELAIATHVVVMERMLLDIAERSDVAGIELRVLKGSAFAHTAYPIPELRPFADIDLLVRSGDLDRTVRELEGMGVHRRVPELRRGFDRRFARTVTTATPAGHEVDVHRTIASGPFTFLVDAEELFERATTFDLAGRTLPCLEPTAALVHACVHQVLGGRPRLLTVRDVAQHAELEAIHHGELVELARRWKLTAVVARALDDARTALELRPEWQSELRGLLRPTAEETELLGSFPAQLGQGAQQAVSALHHVPGLQAKMSYAAAFAWPSRAHLRHRGLTRWAHFVDVARRGGGRLRARR